MLSGGFRSECKISLSPKLACNAGVFRGSTSARTSINPSCYTCWICKLLESPLVKFSTLLNLPLPLKSKVAPIAFTRPKQYTHIAGATPKFPRPQLCIISNESGTSSRVTYEPPLSISSWDPISTSEAWSKVKDGGIVSLELWRSLLRRSPRECCESK